MKQGLGRSSARLLVAFVSTGLLLAAGSALALHYSSTRLSQRGMIARIHGSADASSPPVLVVVDRTLDPERCARLAGFDPRQPFAVEWEGLALVTERGIHRIRARVDDGVIVWVGDEVILEETTPGRRDISAPVDLSPGLHPLRVRYVQRGGDLDFRFTWARPSWREHFTPVLVIPPADSHRESSRPATFQELRVALSAPTIVAAAWSLWILAVAGVLLARMLLRLAGGSAAAAALLSWRGAAVIVAATVVLGAGAHVGLEPWRGWAPDELSPSKLLPGMQVWFSNGWHSLYPPVHYYALALVTLPFHLLAQWQLLDLGEHEAHALMHLATRALSVLLALLALLATWLLARRVVGPRRARLAPLLLLCAPTFVFYAKWANVDLPYVFWVAAAMLAFVMAIETRSITSHSALGACAALAVATKDQAYAFFPGAAIVLLWQAWTASGSGRGVAARLAAVARDRALWAGAATFIVVYALGMGIVWNARGAARHFALLAGGVADSYRMFPATPAGLLDLGATTLLLLPGALGPIVAAFALAGLVVAMLDARAHRGLLLLLVFVVSYAVCFLAIAGYVYDRFLLGFAIIAAPLAALGLDSVASLPRRPAARTALVAAVLVLASAPVITLTRDILGDSRRQVERWMQSHLDQDPLVVGAGLKTYLPNLHPFRYVLLEEAGSADLASFAPDVIVLNEHWIERADGETGPEIMARLEAAGYEEVFAVRENAARRWTSLFTEVDALVHSKSSNVVKINPPLSVWMRSDALDAGSGR